VNDYDFAKEGPMPVGVQTTKPVAPTGVADVVICIDITYSMQGCIDAVKANINKFVDNLITPTNNRPIDWRATAVGYRDVTDSEAAAFEGLDKPFTDDTEELRSRVASFVAAGGGDNDESALDALYKIATELKWPHEVGQAHRIVMLFTDADTHAEMDATTKPSGPRDAGAVFQRYSDDHIKLFIWGPDSVHYKTLAGIPKSEYFSLGTNFPQIKKQLSGADFAKVLEQAAETVSGAVGGAPIVGPSSGIPTV
jgi:hypothetical protein